MSYFQTILRKKRKPWMKLNLNANKYTRTRL
jgi:hypothetical protein